MIGLDSELARLVHPRRPAAASQNRCFYSVLATLASQNHSFYSVLGIAASLNHSFYNVLATVAFQNLFLQCVDNRCIKNTLFSRCFQILCWGPNWARERDPSGDPHLRQHSAGPSKGVSESVYFWIVPKAL